MAFIEAGEYLAKAVETQWCLSSKGTKSICVRFELLSGDDAKGKFINWYGYFSEKTWERTIESLRYMGFKGDDLTELGELSQEVRIVCVVEEYEGREQVKVKWINSCGSTAIKVNSPMPESDIRSFAAAMQSRIDAMERKSYELKTADKIPF